MDDLEDDWDWDDLGWIDLGWIDDSGVDWVEEDILEEDRYRREFALFHQFGLPFRVLNPGDTLKITYNMNVS